VKRRDWFYTVVAVVLTINALVLFAMDVTGLLVTIPHDLESPLGYSLLNYIACVVAWERSVRT
jgi:hypothetical protein